MSNQRNNAPEAVEPYGYTYDYVRLSPSKQIGLHSHAQWELDYIVRGRGQRTIGGTTEPFAAGDLVLVPPHVPHCWRFDMPHADGEDTIENVSIRVDDAWLEAAQRVFGEMSAAVESFRSHAVAAVFDRQTSDAVAQAMLDMRDEEAAWRLTSMLRIVLLLSKASGYGEIGGERPATADERCLNDVRAFVACNFMRRITLDDVASHVGKSRASFCRWYAAHAGTTFFSFLIRYRVERACDLLASHPEMSVGQVLLRCGFSDAPYFFRVFRDLMGMTPREYRRRAEASADLS